MKLRNKKGFTLIEVIVVAGIIAVLAGILVPLIFKEIDESKTVRAEADLRSISNALIVLKKDTGQWPINATCAAAVTILASADGAAPTLTGAGWDNSSIEYFDNFLSIDDNACWPVKWKGPYLARVKEDPWGNQYVLNAKDFSGTGAIWILSAGPDGVVDTPSAATAKANDDIGLRLR